jgi:hypothetical protein
VKKILLSAISSVALSLVCHADDVVMKDGRKIEFKTLEDAGDTYVITTPENTRLVVKRGDVDSFAKTEHVSPLTGATVSFDKKAKLNVDDLLKRAEFMTGSWKTAPDGSVSCEKPGPRDNSTLHVRVAPSAEEYNLTAVVERDGEGDNIGFGLTGPGGAQMTYIFDLDMGKESCVFTADRKRISTVAGRQFTAKKARVVTFMVRKSGVVVQLDGKDFSTIRTDWKLTPFPGIMPTEPGFGVEALGAGVRISKLSISYLAGQR